MFNDSNNSPENYVRELYERFRRNMENLDNSEFYEKEELLDIYDYAIDENDDLTLFNVFLTAARLYPDSDFLDERKAFFISPLNADASRRIMNLKPRKANALWGVLALGLNNYPEGNPEADLNALLAKDLKFENEAVVRLIDLLQDMNRLDLLVEHLGRLQQLALDTEVLLYETADVLSRNDEYRHIARDIAEELTKQAPFSIDGWIMLARIELAMDHASEAVSACDYALAIDPDNPQANLVKAIAMVQIKEMRLEAIQKLEKLHEQEPDNSLIVHGLAEAYKKQRRKKAAMELYASYIRNHPDSIAMMMDLLAMQPANTEHYLKLFDSIVGNDESKWLDMAVQLHNHDLQMTAIEVLFGFEIRYGLQLGAELLLHFLYEQREYEIFIKLFNEIATKNKDNPDIEIHLSGTAFCMMASALLKTENFEEAEVLSMAILQAPPPCDNQHDIQSKIRISGLMALVANINYLASHPKIFKKKPKNYDPLTDFHLL